MITFKFKTTYIIKITPIRYTMRPSSVYYLKKKITKGELSLHPTGFLLIENVEKTSYMTITETKKKKTKFGQIGSYKLVYPV